jgi:hypothetical protein
LSEFELSLSLDLASIGDYLTNEADGDASLAICCPLSPRPLMKLTSVDCLSDDDGEPVFEPKPF